MINTLKSNYYNIFIITGFLGSGKTSFIKSLLNTNPNAKLGIIENEVGQVSIDSTIVGKSSPIVEISAGCVCCTNLGNLEESLELLVSQYPDLNHILIESTGIADPSKIANELISLTHKERFPYRGCLCIVDAEYFLPSLDEVPVLLKQVSFADIVFINKSDRIELKTQMLIRDFIKEANPLANIYETLFSTTPYFNLLEFEASNNINKLLQIKNLSDSPHSQVNTFTFTYKQLFDRNEFQNEMQYLLKTHPNIYRAKGIINFADSPQSHLFQSVRYNMSIEELPDEQYHHQSTLVFIGKNISQQEIKLAIEESIAQ